MYVGNLGLPLKHEKEGIEAHKTLMGRGSFQEKKGFLQHCVLSKQHIHQDQMGLKEWVFLNMNGLLSFTEKIAGSDKRL